MAGLAETLFEKLGSVFTSNPGNAVKTADKGLKASQSKPALANPSKPAEINNEDALKTKIDTEIRYGLGDSNRPIHGHHPVC